MKESDELYIGLMSGTSIDGIDVALVCFSDDDCKLLASYIHPIDAKTKNKLGKLSNPLSTTEFTGENRIELMAELDAAMGHAFANAVNQLLKIKNIDSNIIKAIGSHGQTIRHRPDKQYPFSLQIGDANIIAEKTGIKTVADFRRMDIAAGGQGAPLAPAFHNALLRNNHEDRIILNLGGIANVTLLPKEGDQPVIGFDTGTANTLLDAWYKKYHPESDDGFDRDSEFAQQGQLDHSLLNQLLKDPYFERKYPKSTGREYFNLDWLNQQMNQVNCSNKPENIQRTLLQFTVQTIADSIDSLAIKDYKVLACGGGMHNQYLLDLLSQALGRAIQTTNDFSVDGDYLEAMTFAWLAKQRLDEKPGNLPSVTGASQLKILGGVYLP